MARPTVFLTLSLPISFVTIALILSTFTTSTSTASAQLIGHAETLKRAPPQALGPELLDLPIIGGNALGSPAVSLGQRLRKGRRRGAEHGAGNRQQDPRPLKLGKGVVWEVADGADDVATGGAEAEEAEVDVVEFVSEAVKHPERELLLVIELCRHGDRSPLYQFPADALPASKWPEGIGELTSVGQRAHYDLGTRLRARYVESGFLSYSWKPREVYVRSTTIDRTLMSAASQMAGMFPAGTARVADVGVEFGADPPAENTTGLPGRWQVVPIHTVPLRQDDMLIAGGACPRHVQLMETKRQSSAWAALTAEKEKLFAAVAGIMGVRNEQLTLHSMSEVNDVWTCYEAHNVPLPKGVTKEMRRDVKALADWLLLFGNEGKEVRRLRSGLLLNDIKRRMLLAKRKNEGRLDDAAAAQVKKFVLYSAHDTTVAAALSALNIQFGTNPPYNSTVIFELWHDKKARKSEAKYLVRVEYNGVSKRVDGCPASPSDDDEVCNIENYLEATEAVTIPSKQARVRECSTGVSRHMAAISALFVNDPVYELDDGYQSAPRSGRAASSSGGFEWLSILFVVVLISAIVLVFLKTRTKYVYAAVPGNSSREDDLRSGRSEFGRMTDRSILL